MSTAEIRMAPMGRSEAEQKTGRIRANFEENYRLIKEIKDREGYLALGCNTFEEWRAQSLGQTPMRIHQLLNAATIAEHIEAHTETAVDGDRGEPRGSSPPTPPGIRVRTTAVRSS
jgi:hypothetical protein